MIALNKNLDLLMNKIGYKFNDIELLKEAITHSSYANEHSYLKINDNEKLEFLGDSVMDLITTEYITELYDFFREGELSKIKSQITSASGKAHIGVYAEGDAEFLSGSKVTVGNGVGQNYGIGVYTKAGYNKAVNTDIKLTGEKTIGFYLGATGGTGSTVTHTGTIDVGQIVNIDVEEIKRIVLTENDLHNLLNDLYKISN